MVSKKSAAERQGSIDRLFLARPGQFCAFGPHPARVWPTLTPPT